VRVFILILFIFGSLSLVAVQNCLDFDYDQVQVDHDASLNMGTSDITIEAWIKTDHVVTGNDWPQVVGKHTWGTRQGFALFIANTSNKIAFEVWVGGDHYVVWGEVINDGKWHHVVGRRSGNYIHVFKDGVAAGWSQPGSNGNINCSEPLMIGEQSWGSNNFEGMIDEVRVWKRALSNDEIIELMFKELDGTETNLQAYYQFNETSGTTLPDQTTNNNDGTLGGNPTWTASYAPIASDILDNMSNIRGVWNSNSSHTSSLMTISCNIGGFGRIIFGHNSDSLEFNSVNVPSGIESRLARVWRMEVYGNTFTGDIVFDCSDLISRNDNYRLLVDADGDFSDAAVYYGSLESPQFTIFDHEFEHSYYYTLAIGNDIPPSNVILDCVDDSFVHSINSETNYGSDESVRVGSINDPAYDLGIKRGFVKFDLSSISQGSNITSVTLQFFQTDVTVGVGFEVFPVQEDWDEQLINWNNQPVVGNSFGRMNLISVGITTYEDTDLLNLVQNWVNGSVDNYGLSFRFHDENYNYPSNAGTMGDTFASRENTNQSYIPPQLLIDFLNLSTPLVTITMENNNIELTWEPIPGATSYKVYSSDDPNAPIDNWNLEEEVTEISWNKTETGSKKFYQVKAVN